MIHPDVDDGTIIWLRGSLHGTCAVGADTTVLDSFRTTNLAKPPNKSTGRASKGNGAEDIIQTSRDIHRDIEAVAAEREDTLWHALHHARVSRGKVLDFVASVDGHITHPLSQTVLKVNDGDNSLKQRKSFLEW
jgi:hypothetical protein